MPLPTTLMIEILINQITKQIYKGTIMKTSIISLAIIAMLVLAYANMKYINETFKINKSSQQSNITSNEPELINSSDLLERYELNYNDEGLLSQKIIYRWNSKSNEWIEYIKLKYEYKQNN